MQCRWLLVALFALCALTAALGDSDRADLRLNDGTELHAARVVIISGDKVTITHKGGVLVVSVNAVPLDVLARANDRIAIESKERQRVAAEVAERDSARRQARANTMSLVPVPEAKPRVSSRMTLSATGGIGPRDAPENGCVVAVNAGGRGTAFVLRQPNGFVLVSNQHVIDGRPPHRFELPGAKTLKPTGGFLACDRDIAVFDLAEPAFAAYFEMEPDVDTVALGEDVVIYGNSEGAGVRLSHAKLLAKNPVLIEVSGGIVHGNSGGPIVRAKTGRVIAVSTYARSRPRARTLSDLVEEVALPRVQFYGVRIDTLKKTAPFDFGAFVADSANMEADDARMRNAIALAVLLINSPDREMRQIAATASPAVIQIWAMRNADPFTFRQKAAQLVRPISPASSFIHLEKREALLRSCAVVRQCYRELIPDFRP